MTNETAPSSDGQSSPQKLGKAAGEAFVAATTAMLESESVERVAPSAVVELLRWAYPNGLQDERASHQSMADPSIDVLPRTRGGEPHPTILLWEVERASEAHRSGLATLVAAAQAAADAGIARGDIARAAGVHAGTITKWLGARVASAPPQTVSDPISERPPEGSGGRDLMTPDPDGRETARSAAWIPRSSGPGFAQ